MYVQVTTRCNMDCAHCCFNCTHKGSDMTRTMFKRAIEFVSECGSNVELGGGEPTLHPHFWEFLGLSLSVGDVWLATNGSQTETALRLCDMARRGVIGCALSQDGYHDDIDYHVTEAFQKDMERTVITPDNGKRYYSNFGYHPKSWSGFHSGEGHVDKREIRDVSHDIGNNGRARLNELGHNDRCTGCGIMIKPNGDIRACACTGAPKLGNIRTGVEIPDEWDASACYREEQNQCVLNAEALTA